MNVTPKFRPPYVARIVCQVGSEIVELARYRRPVDPHAWRSWTEGREERCGIEAPLSNHETITCRPGTTRCERAKAIRQLPPEGRHL